MSDTSNRHPNALRPVVYELPGMNTVSVDQDIEYHRAGDQALRLDIYRPAAPARRSPLPLVLFVTGFPDVGVRTPLGCLFKEVAMTVSMAKLVAASGMAAVTYTSSRPADDIDALVDYVTTHAADLGIDASGWGVWAFSAHGALALSALMNHPTRFRAAVLSNPYSMDVGGTSVADAASQWGFAAVDAGQSVADLPPDVPLFIARAGRDEMPGLNDALDRFAAAALAHNLPLVLANHPEAPHAFEINHDSDVSRLMLRQMLAFMRSHLVAGSARELEG